MAEGSITRRAALARFAVVAGGVTAGPLLDIANASATRTAGFAGERQQVYRALALAYDRLPGSVVDVRECDVVADFANRSARATASYRTWADAVLDAVQWAPRCGQFTELSRSAQRRELCAWGAAREPADDLMFKQRPGDAAEPADLRASNARMRAAVTARLAAMPRAALQPIGADTLPAFTPPPGRPVPIARGEPLGTEVRIRRQLRVSSYELVAMLFADGAPIIDEVRFP